MSGDGGRAGFVMMNTMRGGGSVHHDSQGSRSLMSCQDCGNQAKKECVHMRCRTCCKGRGFQCQTHVKSTWIPVYRRPRRLHNQQQSLLPPRQQLLQGLHNINTITTATTTTPAASSGSVETRTNFPGEVSCPGMFRRVRVRSIDNNINGNGVDQYAYQTGVIIAGHLFKGILYDEGPDNSNTHHIPQFRPAAAAAPAMELLHPSSSSSYPINLPPPPPVPATHLIPHSRS